MKEELAFKSSKNSLLSSITSQLEAIEKRDLRVWLLLLTSSVIVGFGALAILFPTRFLKQSPMQVQFTISHELLFGLAALIVLLNFYVISRQLEFRHTRRRLISSSLQNELIRLQSFTDPLTEVYNRRSLDEMAGRYISRARRLHSPLTFLLVDVDRFKDVNGRFGHLTGDVVLAEIAALLKSCTRGSDSVVRYGGDEFLVILAECNGRNCQVVLDRVKAELKDWNDRGQLPGFELGLSIGSAEWKDGQTLDEVLDAADKQMFARKK